jgi:hypothetical protein
MMRRKANSTLISVLRQSFSYCGPASVGVFMARPLSRTREQRKAPQASCASRGFLFLAPSLRRHTFSQPFRRDLIE